MESIFSVAEGYFDNVSNIENNIVNNMAAPAAVDSLGGLSTRKFVRRAGNNVTYHGHMPPAAADRVFRAACAEWDVGDMDAEAREDLLGCIAEACLRSTSTETDTTNVVFSYGDDDLELDVLVKQATVKTTQPNPLRVWIRSYHNGEIAARISDLLADPENLALRQRAAADYGASMSDAYLCFDTADALIGFRPVSHSEIITIGRLKAYKLRTASESATSKGLERTEADRTRQIGGRSLAADTALSQGSTTTPQVRTNFAKVN